VNEVEAAAKGERLRVVGITTAAIVLTGFFMVVRFPYDRLALRIAQQVEQQTDTRITFADVGIGLVRWAPGLTAEQARIVRPDGTRLDLETAGVRPALALSWLRGEPALAIELTSAMGDASGVVTLGERGGYDGSLTNIDLDRLPQGGLGTPLRVQGRADADLDVSLGDSGPEGSVVFEARDGVVSHPELPLPMPFQKLTGEIDLGGNTWATIREIHLDSPLATGTARGTIDRAPTFAAAPLRLELEFTVSGAVQSSLNAQGVSVGDSGQVRVAVTGTPARPVVR